MELVFWGCFALVAYVYVGYPLLMAAWARLRPRPWHGREGYQPTISIVLVARNEAHRLPARIGNLLALHYPPSLVELIVVSDGSHDGTVDALARWRGRVRVIEQPARGKAAGLNAAVAAATHDVVVFADARQRFAEDALLRLVSPLADDSVGAVSGELILDCEAGSESSSIGETIGAYWRFEKWLRRQESLAGSMLGATGAIYALRRALWRPLPEGTILDDVLVPMRAVLAGKRVVFEPRARAFDETSPDAGAEARRKTRTLAGNYQVLAIEPRLLVPVANRAWVQYWSHKVGRLLVPWALIGLLVLTPPLALRHPVYLLALAAELTFAALALYGAVLDGRRPVRPHSAPVTALDREAIGG